MDLDTVLPHSSHLSLLFLLLIYTAEHTVLTPLYVYTHRSLISDIFLKDSSYNYRPHRHITAVIPDSFQVTLRCTPPQGIPFSSYHRHSRHV